MLQLIEDKFDSSLTFSDKVTLLESTSGSNNFSTLDSRLLEKIRVKIRLCFQDDETRLEGLLLMHTVLLQCGEDFFEENAFFWLQATIQVIKGSDCCNHKEMACTIIKNICSRLSAFPQLRKEVGEKLLSNLVLEITETTTEDDWIAAFTDCLATCMKEVPAYCSSYKKEIEEFLMIQIDSPPPVQIGPLAACFSHLPSIGERCSSQVQYSSNWVELMNKMVNTLTESLTILYSNLKKGPSCDSPDSLSRPPELRDHYSLICSHSHRFRSVSHCVAKMLSYSKYAVKVPLSRLLLVVDEALRVSPDEVVCQDEAASFVAAVLPTVHHSALLVLESLLLSCQDYMMTKESAVGAILLNQLFSNSLKLEVSSSFLRGAIYKLLRMWIEKLRPSSLKNVCDKIFSEVSSDISPLPKSTKSTVVPLPSSQNSTESPRILPSPVPNGPVNSNVNYSLCADALKLLSSMLYAAGGCLTSNFLKLVREKVTKCILTMQEGPVFPPPYNNDMCRLEAYKLFLNLVVHSTATSSSPLSMSMSVFRHGERDINAEISSLCLQASAVCMAIISPQRALPKVHYVPEETTHKDAEMECTVPKTTLSISSVHGASDVDWEASGNSAVTVQNSHAMPPATRELSPEVAKAFAHNKLSINGRKHIVKDAGSNNFAAKATIANDDDDDDDDDDSDAELGKVVEETGPRLHKEANNGLEEKVVDMEGVDEEEEEEGYEDLGEEEEEEENVDDEEEDCEEEDEEEEEEEIDEYCEPCVPKSHKMTNHHEEADGDAIPEVCADLPLVVNNVVSDERVICAPKNDCKLKPVAANGDFNHHHSPSKFVSENGLVSSDSNVSLDSVLSAKGSRKRGVPHDDDEEEEEPFSEEIVAKKSTPTMNAQGKGDEDPGIGVNEMMEDFVLCSPDGCPPEAGS